jgi:nucleoside-diphosphate-sugar epimerase
MNPEHFEDKAVLVTGGLGFIGSNLAMALVDAGARVTVLDSLIPQHGGSFFNIAPVKDRLTVNISDMRDADSLNILVREKDYIFHLAGQASHGDSMRDPQMDLGVNCISTINLVEACRKFNQSARIIYTSTRQVYGVPQTLPVTEQHRIVPIDVNGINKVAAEHYHLLYDSVYDVRSTILRLTNTYGPRMQVRNDRQSFIGIMIRQALRREPLKIYGTGEQIRDFNYVDDVVEALLLAASNDRCLGHVYNLGAPEHYSLLQFVSMLSDLCEVRHDTIPFPKDREAIDIGDYYGDYSAFEEAVGWTPRVDLPAGLRRTIDYLTEHAEVYWK